MAKYLFFWGHQPTRDGSVTKTCFSQWFAAGFTIEDIFYPTAEHYMMAEKARLFADEEIRSQILTATHPKQAKDYGRKVRNFDPVLWEAQRLSIVVAGNLAKFQQNPQLREFLLGTGDRVLVEASPLDKVWGIGLAADHPDAMFPEKWPGLNLLGIALMEVRSKIIRSVREVGKPRLDLPDKCPNAFGQNCRRFRARRNDDTSEFIRLSPLSLRISLFFWYVHCKIKISAKA